MNFIMPILPDKKITISAIIKCFGNPINSKLPTKKYDINIGKIIIESKKKKKG